MKTRYAHEISTPVLNKIKDLWHLLEDVRGNYEVAANGLSAKALKQQLWGLAQECCQYANELKSSIESMGVEPGYFETQQGGIGNIDIRGIQPGVAENEIWQYCAGNELRVLKAYRQVLNESLLNENLRKMIRYQFNGLLFIFLQIKLLKQ